jgi:hypothetical protein
MSDRSEQALLAAIIKLYEATEHLYGHDATPADGEVSDGTCSWCEGKLDDKECQESPYKTALDQAQAAIDAARPGRRGAERRRHGVSAIF